MYIHPNFYIQNNNGFSKGTCLESIGFIKNIANPFFGVIGLIIGYVLLHHTQKYPFMKIIEEHLKPLRFSYHQFKNIENYKMNNLFFI